MNYSREQAQTYRISNDEPIKLETLAKKVAHYCQNYTQFGSERPFGCALVFIGVDAFGPHVFLNSPDGDYKSFNAQAIGFNSNIANNYLLSSYNEKMSFNELLNLLIYVVDMSIDEKITKDNIRIGYIKSEDLVFKTFTQNENESLINNMQIPLKFNESITLINEALERLREIFIREDLRRLVIERKYLMEFFDESLIEMKDPDLLPTLVSHANLIFEKNGLEIMYNGDLVVFFINDYLDFGIK